MPSTLGARRAVLASCPAAPRDADPPEVAKATLVYSTTLTEPRSARTQVEPAFDPEALRRLLAGSTHDVLIGGPHLAAHAFRAGLVGEVPLFASPVLVGGGTRALPRGVRIDLELAQVERFGSGVAHLHHRVR